jgi:hypothetical protein
MTLEYNTRKKLQAFVSQVEHLLLSDFPHSSTESALDLIRVFYEKQLNRLQRAINRGNHNILIQTCITINERIYQHLPLLGFLL